MKTLAFIADRDFACSMLTDTPTGKCALYGSIPVEWKSKQIFLYVASRIDDFPAEQTGGAGGDFPAEQADGAGGDTPAEQVAHTSSDARAAQRADGAGGDTPAEQVADTSSDLPAMCLTALRAERQRKLETLTALPDRLVPWYERNKRDLPWRHTSDPYRIWLSEIMLQQTRVQAATGYYTRFVRELPDVYALAACPDDRLMKLWEGLGYYSRARNLKKAAAILAARRGFPRTRSELAALPGVGDYTAGAIASIAFGEREPAVDGNVLRVVARVAECYPDVSDPLWKRELTDALRPLYPAGKCGAFTQSFMDLASTVCLPASPRCPDCPLCDVCLAYARHTTDRLPVRAKKTQRATEKRTVFVLTLGGLLAAKKRPDAGLLSGLWELPNVPGALTADQALIQLTDWGLTPDGAFTRTAARHIFTHRVWEMTVYTLPCRVAAGSFEWVKADSVALPTAFRKCLGSEKAGPSNRKSPGGDDTGQR